MPNANIDTGKGILYIADPGRNLHAPLTATENAMLTVFNNHDTGINEESVHTAGTWEEESISDGDGFTTLSSSSSFPAHAVGWTLQPNANKPLYFPILSVSGGSITVAGDLTGVASEGDQYFILHPPGIDKSNGAVDTTSHTPRNLAFGYHYITPMAGVHTGSAIEGRQPGNNFAGQYQVWNRNYLPDIGRWTTPDPAMSPWWNLLAYVNARPLTQSDPSGLHYMSNYEALEVAEAVLQGLESAHQRCNERHRERFEEALRLTSARPAGISVTENRERIEGIRSRWRNSHEECWRYYSLIGAARKRVSNLRMAVLRFELAQRIWERARERELLWEALEAERARSRCAEAEAPPEPHRPAPQGPAPAPAPSPDGGGPAPRPSVSSGGGRATRPAHRVGDIERARLCPKWDTDCLRRLAPRAAAAIPHAVYATWACQSCFMPNRPLK